MTQQELIDLLIDAGYNTGFALNGDVLVLWEHEEEPPAPLTRPA
jgi:hypothetical protein